MKPIKKKITYEATIHEDETVSICISSSVEKAASLTELLGCLEMLRQAVILSNNEFKNMYETFKVFNKDDSESSTGTGTSGGESTQY